MEEANKIEIDPKRVIKNNKIQLVELDQKQLNDFIEIVARAYQAKKPAEDDLNAIRKFLHKHPEICPAVFSLSDVTQGQIIKVMIDQGPARIAIEEQLIGLRDGLGYHDAPILERLLIENIVTAWLFVQRCETRIALMQGQQSMRELEFWERRLSLAQRRYLTACESLAKIRKMNIPALQLNIGNKQINVAGRVQAAKNEPAPEVIEGEVR
jgi:hypothetical protein